MRPKFLQFCVRVIQCVWTEICCMQFGSSKRFHWFIYVCENIYCFCHQFIGSCWCKLNGLSDFAFHTIFIIYFRNQAQHNSFCGVQFFNIPLKCKSKQEGIPVRCVPPACQPYVFQWPKDVSISGGGVLKRTSLNRALDVTSREQGWAPMSLGGWGESHVWSPGGGARGCTVRSNASWVMVTWGPPADRQTQLKTLPSHNFIKGASKWDVVGSSDNGNA